MGILQFYKKLVKLCNNNAIIEIDRKFIEKKWDYLYFDFQSILYTTYQLFSSEINYFIKLMFHIRYLINANKSIHNNYKSIIEYIIYKYENYFIQIFKDNFIDLKNGILSYDIDIIDNILCLKYNDEDILIDILTDYVIILVKEISNHHLKFKNTYDRTFIFFDGIPTKSKIKEQLSRKIYPEIIKNIKYDLNNNTIDEEKEINEKLLNDSPPSIGIGKPIIYKIKEKLTKVNDSIRGRFNINNLENYGEAEHQMMAYLNNNLDIFQNANILLVSPDADLILLSIINYTKKIYIDIMRVNTEDEKSNIVDYKLNNNEIISPFYYKNGYIFIQKIIECLNLRSSQEQIDISFILLLLGDDFLPIIPEININSLNDIINAYKKLNINIIDIKNKSSDMTTQSDTIIDQQCKYELNYYNFIKIIEELDKIPKQKSKLLDKHFIHREKNKIQDLNKFYFYTDYDYKFEMFEKLYYLSKGIYKNQKHKLEIIMNNKISSSKIINKQIKNYLEGCQFIFDIYLNNKIKNYNWVYNYENAPYLENIYAYLKDKELGDFEEIFDYVGSNNPNKFLSYKTYQDYMEYLKKRNIINILKKNKIREKITDENIQDFEKEYFIYRNIKNIFQCSSNKKYINKCIDIQIYDIPDEMIIDIDIDTINMNTDLIKMVKTKPTDIVNKIIDLPELIGGNNKKYYFKYLKYKNKYLEFKSM
jgi:hypothetical protein